MQRGKVVAIYKSTLNTSKQKKQKKEKAPKIKTKQPKVVKVSKYLMVVTLVLSAVFFVGLCAPSNFIKNFLLGLLGISAYPICLLSIFLCAMGLGKTKYEINKKHVIYLSCSLFFVLMIAHLVLTTNIEMSTYSKYLKDTYNLKTSGAGLIMSLFTYSMKKYLTVVGAYILSVILLTVFIGLILDAKHVAKHPKEQEIAKSKFDFSGMIDGDIEEKEEPKEVEITLKHKQEDLKKKIARQKLGMEAGSSTIISSSMRLDDVPDTPNKYKSKRDYILTPPEIVIPEYEKPKTENVERRPQPSFKPDILTRDENIKKDIFTSKDLNSDIFVNDTDDFYKDAKVIEGKEIAQESKIQEIKPTTSWQDINVKDSSFDINKPNAEQNNINSVNTISSVQNGFHTSNIGEETSNQDGWKQNIKQVFNSVNQEDVDIAFDDVEDDEIEEFELVEEKENLRETTTIQQTSLYSKPEQEIKLPSANPSEVVRSASFTTKPEVFTREIVEEKKENLLGRPKKHHAEYVKPPVDLLEYIENPDVVTDEECNENIEKLERVLEDFKINAKVKAVQVGPAVTRYEIGMPQGVSVKKVQFHADDIAMALASNGSIRIEAPIPGKNAVGIEVPNRTVMGVSLREMIESLDYQKRVNPMSFVLGKDINGSVQFCNLDKMPHLLVAGSTGSGKSVCLNTMLISMLYKSSPEDLKLILIDPKTVEFSTYANLPHLLTPEIITTKEQTINALNWAIKEMEERYGLLQRNQVVNIKDYNNLDIVKNNEVEKLPYIVIVIDELGDLMIDAKREMEERIMKLAQKSRAAGIHLVIATQRPSVDVITGTIKANLPSRIAFALTNFADSKTVLDMGGAEKLLGKGDMLFKPSDLPEPRRVQGAYISSREVASVVKFIKENNRADFDEDAQRDINQSASASAQNMDGDVVNFDPVLKDALRFFIQANQASITMIQRRFGVGYARAARIIDQMEQNGFISPADGSKPRQVLISLEEYNLIFG